MGNTCDVIIVGAGVVGLTLGVELLKKGCKVICIEKKLPGTGSSNAALGLIYPISPLSTYRDLVNVSIEAFDTYRSFLGELETVSGKSVQTTNTGMIQVSFSNEENVHVERTYVAYSEIGFPVDRLDKSTILNMEPNISSNVESGLFFPSAFHVYSEQLIENLVDNFIKLGGELILETLVESLLLQNNLCQGVRTLTNTFYSHLVVLCTGAWQSLLPNDEFNHNIVIPVRGQVIVLNDILLQTIRHLIYTEHLDIIPRTTGHILVGSTLEIEGFNQYSTAGGVHFLLEKLFLAFPITRNLPFERTWAGLRPKTSDELPLVGKVLPIDNLHISTGHYRNGIFLSPLIAKSHVNLIMHGLYDSYMSLFEPSRLLRLEI